MTRLVFFILLLVLNMAPARAEWSTAAFHSLAYLVNEPALNADMDVLDAAYQKIYLVRLDDIYVRELVKKRVISREEYLAGYWDFDVLLPGDRAILNGIRRDFTQAAARGLRDLKSRVQETERTVFRRSLNSSDMVRLKDFVFIEPKFFELPLSYTAYTRFSQDVDDLQRYDALSRAPLAEELAQAFVLQRTRYAFDDELVPVADPALVARNQAAYLVNEFTVGQLQEMLDLVRSGTGQRFLAMRDNNFRNRVLSIENMYKRLLADAAAGMRKQLKNRTPILLYKLPPRPGHYRVPRPGGVTIDINVDLD